MPTYEIIMPKLGESVEEATITKWFIKENDIIEEDQVLLEIATDKVDSEIPSPVSGKVQKILFPQNSKIAVGTVIAIINLGGENDEKPIIVEKPLKSNLETKSKQSTNEEKKVVKTNSPERFYSPLVKSIAKSENISLDELNEIPGTGNNGRLRKEDLLSYIQSRAGGLAKTIKTNEKQEIVKPTILTNSGDEIIEMDRMRKIIADHMVMSKQVSPHVTNIVEADVTHLVQWRNKNKELFEKRVKTKLTFMPIFIEVTAKALCEFPMVNASVDGTKIILRKSVNIGIAVALPTGNLIVPVIKNADRLNLAGIAKEMNQLADRARNNKLSPDDITNGTFTITNFGTFRNIMGMPIINQPQVAILATGMIEKKPAVLETPDGDVIAIRHKMYISLTYDHRIIDGALGGSFLRRIADLLEQF